MVPHLRTPIICLAALAASALPDAHGTAKLEKFWGYAEFVKADTLIVDGQRVVAGPHLKLRVANISVLSSIPLGDEVKVKGQRAANGALVADEVEGKPNGTDGSEQEIIAASDQAEQTWVDKKMMFEAADSGKIVKIGDILESGPEVDRVRRIMDRLRPSYVSVSALRVRVVKTDQWNASAMANGAVWVFTGLMDAMDDDEMAIVLGHELTHYTYEHVRRNVHKGGFAQILGVGAAVAASQIHNQNVQTVAALGGQTRPLRPDVRLQPRVRRPGGPSGAALRL